MSELRDLLVVEDEPVVLAAVRRILAPEGLEIDLADGAQRATEALAEHTYRVVLCDLMLPGSSGFTLLAEVRNTSPATQFVVLTGYATLDNALASFCRGAFDFLPKPFEPDELLAVVGRALCYHRRATAGTTPAAQRATGGEGREMHFLGRHAWAALDADGSATVGLGETLSAAVGELAAIELPGVGEPVAQGRVLARLVGRDRLVHRVWAPLSGQVIAVNPRLAETPGLARERPLDAGWLARLVPARLDDELARLAPCAVARTEQAPPRGARTAPAGWR